MRNDRKTREVIAAMLKERVGHSILDSGDYYGRNYSRNQARDFEKEPSAILHWEYERPDVTLNLYHWLVERLVYSPKYQALFDRLVELSPEHEHYFDLTERFPFYLLLAGGRDINCGIYAGEGEDLDIAFEPSVMAHAKPRGKYRLADVYAQHPELFKEQGRVDAVNTYNHESSLSRVIQFSWFHIDGETVVMLFVHGGCDVRGGYTAPKIFHPKDGVEYLFDDRQATICCVQESEHRWYTDDAGYHWYHDSRELNLEKFAIIKQEDLDDLDNPEDGDAIRAELEQNQAAWDLYESAASGQQMTLAPELAPVRPRFNRHYILVDENNIGHCPLCGGALEAY